MKKKGLNGWCLKMVSEEYEDYDNLECSRCGLDIKVAIINGDLYNICGCGDAVNIGEVNKRWLPEKWK